MVGQREPLGYAPNGALGSHMAQSCVLGWQVFPVCVGTFTAAPCSLLLLTCGK